MEHEAVIALSVQRVLFGLIARKVEGPNQGHATRDARAGTWWRQAGRFFWV